MNDFKRNGRFGDQQSGKGFGRKDFGRGSSTRPQGQMHQAVCAQCGKSCEVPFRPNGQRPVYCRDCFGGSKPVVAHREPQRFTVRAPEQPRQTPDPRIDDILRNIDKMQVKLDSILLRIAIARAQATVEPEVVQKTSKKKKVS